MRFVTPALGLAAVLAAPAGAQPAPSKGPAMNLGSFSVSLAVKDLAASKAFYQHLGFTVLDGDESQHWLILQHGTAKIGLFQGMFTENVLTFNPSDVRAIQGSLKAAGVALEIEAEASGTGPASAMLKDPDGNIILLDQH